METPLIGNITGPKVMAEIRIQLIHQDGSIGISVQTNADPISALGLLELAKEQVKNQNTQPKSSLVIARPGIG